MVKPNELVGSGDFNCYSEAGRLFQQYRNLDCVIAYRKCFMGFVMVVQGKRDMFGFIFLDSNVTKWRNAEMQRKSIREVKKLFDLTDLNQVVIVDEEKYKLFERKVLFSSIESNE